MVKTIQANMRALHGRRFCFQTPTVGAFRRRRMGAKELSCKGLNMYLTAFYTQGQRLLCCLKGVFWCSTVWIHAVVSFTETEEGFSA